MWRAIGFVFALLGCGGQVHDDVREMHDAFDAEPTLEAPELVFEGGAADASATGDCTLVVTQEADGGPLLGGSGKASWQPKGFAHDINLSPGYRTVCVTQNERLVLDFLDGASRGRGELSTTYGLEGTGTATALCDVDITAWPTATSSALVGTFHCAPMKMTWGATLHVSGTISAK
jgi:hypothetical protein